VSIFADSAHQKHKHQTIWKLKKMKKLFFGHQYWILLY